MKNSFFKGLVLAFLLAGCTALHLQTLMSGSRFSDDRICSTHYEVQKNESSLPPSFDWREYDVFTPVKNQLNLGSCGVFSAVSVFEALIKKETGAFVDLSEQHVINASADWAPSGISAVDAMKFMKESGIALEESLPYEDRKTDREPSRPLRHKLRGYTYLYTNKFPLPEKISTIKKAVYQHGPVATNMIFYADLDRYEKGIYIHDGKSAEEGGHWVVITGWKDDAKIKNGGYWICRNSWGAEWGENGYFRIAYGECGIDDFWFVYGVY